MLIFLLIFIPLILILFILLSYLDYSIIYCEGDIDNFDKLSEKAEDSKNNYKFLTPIKNIGKSIKRGLKKIITNIERLNERIEE
jgi:hypothetical protein